MIIPQTLIRSEDRTALNKLVESVKTNFNERHDEVCSCTFFLSLLNIWFVSAQIRRTWGGGELGAKSQARIAKAEKLKQKELIQKVVG